MIVIDVSNVSKSFNNRVVLRKINLKIERGEFVVIAGPNGSGKSTLLKTMVGLLLPDEGEVKVLGFDVKRQWKKLSKHIGVVLSNERSLYWKLTAWENLDVFGGIYGVPRRERKRRAEELLKTFGIYDHKDKLVEEYSTGMRKRLLLCKALLHDPEILFIDELLNGLDAKAVGEVNTFLYGLSKSGKTIVMVSHILHEMRDDVRVLLLRNGRIEMDCSYDEVFSDGEVYRKLSELVSNGGRS